MQLVRLWLSIAVLMPGILPRQAFAASTLIWRKENGGRSASLSVPTNGHAGFTSLPENVTGIRFTNVLTIERGLNLIYKVGGGEERINDDKCPMRLHGEEQLGRLQPTTAASDDGSR